MLRIGTIVWGVRDVPAAVRFWTQALAYRPREGDDGDWVLLKPAAGTGVQLALQEVRAEAAARRRHHLDLYAFDQTAEVERLVALGAQRVQWRYKPGADYVVLADPDGNLFCVIAAGEAARDPGLLLAERQQRDRLAESAPPPDAFVYRGARALTVLHEQHLRAFLTVWREAKASGVGLPATDDDNYRSYEALLGHVLRAAGSYLTWLCRQLDLPDPGVEAAPPLEQIEGRAEAYIEHVLDRWRLPLRQLPEARTEDRAYTSNWGAPMTVESMLEHAVMHPLRHTFQLTELLARGT